MVPGGLGGMKPAVRESGSRGPGGFRHLESSGPFGRGACGRRPRGLGCHRTSGVAADSGGRCAQSNSRRWTGWKRDRPRPLPIPSGPDMMQNRRPDVGSRSTGPAGEMGVRERCFQTRRTLRVDIDWT